MRYSIMTEQDTATVAALYMDWYNSCEGGCWEFGKAYRRIHQMITIEDSLCLLQKDEGDRITGFAIGYFKEYDDLTAYYLEEIVIAPEYRNRGLGKAFLGEIERRLLAHGAAHLELVSVNDAQHTHFYKSFGLYEAANLKVMSKHYGE